MFDGVATSKYLGVFAALIGAGMGLPIPEEIPVVTAGAFVGHDSQAVIDARRAGQPVPPGLTHWWVMLPLVIVGVVLSDSILYFAGRWCGPWLLSKPWVRRRVITPEKRAKIEANFEKRGVMILLAARFTPGIRTPVFLMAGVLRMPVHRFLLADGLYAIPGVNLLFWLAYWFTDQFVEAVQAVERHKPMAVVAVLAAVGGVLLYKLFVGRKVSTGDPEEIPAPLKPVGVVTHAVEQTLEKTVEKTGSAAAFVLDKVTHPFGYGERDKSPAPPAPPPDGGRGETVTATPPSPRPGEGSRAGEGPGV
jgi:membrane protein DedA with SNARE-associated domain